MPSPDLTQINIETTAVMLPNAITETFDNYGNIQKPLTWTRWPGKRRAAAFAVNAPMPKSLGEDQYI